MLATRLNLGCGDNARAGYINIDSYPWPGVDTVHDLRTGIPCADGAADEVLALDVLEHLPDKIATMNEIWRVLRPGGTVRILVPRADGPGAFSDPTHVSFWTRETFTYFTVGERHYQRFVKPYGLLGGFRVVSEAQTALHIEISLAAVKPDSECSLRSRSSHKCVVYTAITNGKDDLHLCNGWEVLSREADMVAFVDTPVMVPPPPDGGAARSACPNCGRALSAAEARLERCPGCWRRYADRQDLAATAVNAPWRVECLAPRDANPRRCARAYKTLAHEVFPSAAYSLWLDGNVVFHGESLAPLIDRFLRDCDVALFGHQESDCTYHHAERLVALGVETPEVVSRQVERYRQEGLPAHAGMVATGAILRRHTAAVRRFNERWYDEVQGGSVRDQLSFNYCAWRLGLRYSVFPGYFNEWGFQKYRHKVSREAEPR